MTENQQSKAGVWDIIAVVVKWRRLLILNFIAAAIITFIIASFLPKWYSSSAALFPPDQESGGLGLASSLLGSGLGSLLGGSNLSLPTFASMSDVYAAVLRSRIVAEGVIDTNGLMDVYNVKSRELALKILGSHTTVLVQPEGIITVACEDKDPKLAARLVQSYIDELHRVNTDVRESRASATREFVERRLAQNQIDLAAAEEDFKAFQMKNKTISLDEQVKALIGTLAELKSQLVLAEIELGVLKRSFLPTHTEVKQQEAKIEEIQKQIKILEQGNPGVAQDNPLSIPFAEAPDLGLQLARLTRRLKIQETLYELLTQQYEQAKIQEKRDTPTIQVLDPPQVPERKSKPKRATMALMAGMLSLLMTVFGVFGKEFIDRNKQADTEAYRRLENILGSLREDFYQLRSVFKSKKGSGDGPAS